MTDHDNATNPRQLDAALTALAETEQTHRAPQALRSMITRDVHRAMRIAAAEDKPVSVLQNWFEWTRGHWLRTLSMGSMAAAIPLLTGVLLGYQLTGEEESLDDPAIDWLASYSASADLTDQGTSGDLLP